MNRAFDYNGVQISASKSVQKLVRRSRILFIDSGDRDINLFPNNGNFTIYLPRAYERVIGINIKDAEFPAISTAKVWDVSASTGARDGRPAYYPGATLTATNYFPPTTTVADYFFLELQGLNMSDETANAADRSASTNAVFAKFVSSVKDDPIIYNESSNAHQDIEFYPALTKLDRFQIRLRSHTMTTNQHIYWTEPNWSISLEIQTLENAFDEFSTIETRLGDRS
ncbi:MAG: hypothetical protein EB127_29195 [Alphaproteobacteria bacterium]|nr:hypothetical protein [Alphaproteobacteria bacterium]